MSILPARLLTGTVISIAGRALGTALSVGTIAVVTRSLVATAGPLGGVAAYGAYATALAVVAIIAVVADGGLYLVFTRASSQEGADEAALLETVFGMRVWWSLGALAVASVAVVFLPYPALVRSSILVGLWGMVFQLGSQLLLGVFQKRLRMATPALAEVAGRLTQLALVVAVAMRRGGILAFVGAFVIGTAVTFLWNMLRARTFVRFRLFRGGDRARRRALLHDAWPVGLSLVLSVIVFKVDTVLLSLLRPPSDVALYALPYKVLESLLFFPAMVGGLLLPVFSRASTKEARGVSRPLREAVDLFLLGALPVALLLLWAAPCVVHLLGGPAYGASVPVLRILAVAFGALCVGNLYGNAVIAIGCQRQLLVVNALLALVNIGGNLIVIPHFSYLGAAWMTLATELLSVVLAGALLARRRVALVGTDRTMRIFSSALLLGVLLLAPLSPVPRVLVAVGAYLLALLWLGVVRPRELRALLGAQRMPEVLP